MSVYSKFLVTTLQNAVHNRSWKAALLVEAYEQDIDGETYWSQVKQYEIGGYTQGGVSVQLEVSYDAASDTVAVSPVDDTINFGSVNSEDIGAVVIYAWTGSAATSPLLVVDSFGEAEVSNGNEFVYNVPSEGLVTLAINDPSLITP